MIMCAQYNTILYMLLECEGVKVECRYGYTESHTGGTELALSLYGIWEYLVLGEDQWAATWLEGVALGVVGGAGY